MTLDVVAHPALQYAARSWHVLPLHDLASGSCSCGRACDSPGKHPRTEHGVKDATKDPAQIQAWLTQWPTMNVGIATGPSGLLVLDVDPKNGGEASWNDVVKRHGDGIANSIRVRTGGGGGHVYYARPPANGHGDLGNTAGKLGPGLDTRGAGGYVVAPPSLHKSGKRYEWVQDNGLEHELLALPTALFQDLTRVKPREATLVVPEAIADGRRNDTLFRMAASLQRRGLAAPSIKAALLQENIVRCKPPLPEREVDLIVRSATKYEGGAIPDVLVDAGEEDWANAQRLVALHGHLFRHVHEWGWMVWDGRCWSRDTRGRMEWFAKKTLEATTNAVDRLEDEERRKKLRSFVKSSKNGKRIREMIASARSEPGIDVFAEEFDTHDGLLNVRNGVVDLATGELLPHNPELYLTGFSDIAYDAAAASPRWDQYMRDLCATGPGGPVDEEILAHLQRAAGYTLTGYTTEHVLFFLYGNGRNGKSTFIEVLAKILGKLAEPVGFDTFLQSREGRLENTLASLVGKRMATATEAPEGRAFNEEAIKQVTGGDTLRGRHMYKDGFGFVPKFKPWFSGNNKPTIHGVSEGTWSRFNLIPCQNDIPEHKRVKNLKDLLRAELGGILAWAVRGSMEWHKVGLQPPQKVREAVLEYRSENDNVGRWIQERCSIRPDLTMPAGEGVKDYNGWARDLHEKEITANMFGRRLGQYHAGLLKREKNGSGLVVWRGIGLGRDIPAPAGQVSLEAATATSAAPAPPANLDQDTRISLVLETVRAEIERSKGRYVTGAYCEQALVLRGMANREVQAALAELRRVGRLWQPNGYDTYAPRQA